MSVSWPPPPPQGRPPDPPEPPPAPPTPPSPPTQPAAVPPAPPVDPPSGWVPPSSPPPPLPPPGSPFPPPGSPGPAPGGPPLPPGWSGPPQPAWGPPPPPPAKSRTGLVVGLLLGGLALLVLLVVAAAVVIIIVSDDESGSTSAGTTTSRGTTDSTTAGTGPLSSVTGTRAASSLRAEQQQKTPQLTVGAITCPSGTYREGQVVVCQMRLEDASVLYEVEVTGQQSLEFRPTDPIVDTDKAEALMQSREPGTTPDCGSPRVRQLDVGATLTCRSASSTWVFTVTPDGDLFGSKRP